MIGEELERKLDKLKVGETFSILPNTDALAVPGGWLFRTYQPNLGHNNQENWVIIATTFVPNPWS